MHWKTEAGVWITLYCRPHLLSPYYKPLAWFVLLPWQLKFIKTRNQVVHYKDSIMYVAKMVSKDTSVVCDYVCS